MAEAIHQEVEFDAAPQQIYAALLDAERFGKMTGGAPTRIEGAAGGAFSCFGGMIEGRHVELVPGERIVQAWRVKSWRPGLYSLVRFELKDQGGKTQLSFEHVGFPPEEREHLSAGWEANYWGPLRKSLT